MMVEMTDPVDWSVWGSDSTGESYTINNSTEYVYPEGTGGDSITWTESPAVNYDYRVDMLMSILMDIVDILKPSIKHQGILENIKQLEVLVKGPVAPPVEEENEDYTIE